MSSDDPLLDQADALMRRRVFVAGAHAEPDPLSDREAEAVPDDVPVLTEEVVAVPDEAETKLSARDQLEQLITERRAALALEMETWLDEQLPQLVILAMDGITDHLVALITQRAREELLPRLDAVMQPCDDDDRAG